MPLSSKTEKNLEKFVKSFVCIFEQSLLAYYKNLIENIPKSGKWAELVNWVIRICTAGSGSSDYKAAIRVSLALPLLSLILSEVGIHHNRKKLLKLIIILEIYNENEQNKIEIRKNLIEAGILIFRSFEVKFTAATVHNSHELAMLKLAGDACDRIFNFYHKHFEIFKKQNFFISENIIMAVILGKSKRHRGIFTIPNMYLGYSLDCNMTTTRLYEKTPILKIVSEDENYCYKQNSDISDFRLVFQWEEKKETEEEDTINIPNQWGIDNEIILFKNRTYRKETECIKKTSIDRLSINQLAEIELQEIQEKILNKINLGNRSLENFLKEELETLKEIIKYDVVVEVTKLEKELTDIKSIMLVTLNKLTLLEEGQDKLNKIIFPLNEKKYSFGDTVQIALEIASETSKKQLVEKVCLESILARIKIHLSTQIDKIDLSYYIPLEGYYHKLTKHNNFQILNKVIDFIQNPKKNSLLILGESGSGKTFFSAYLSNYLLISLNPIKKKFL